jgi:hypothetical protein
MVTLKSMRLVQMLGAQARVKESSGAAPFGPDPGLWPAWWFDAVDIFQRVACMEMRLYTIYRQQGAFLDYTTRAKLTLGAGEPASLVRFPATRPSPGWRRHLRVFRE